MRNSVRIYAAVWVTMAVVSFSGCSEKGIPADLKENLDKYIGFWNTGNFSGIEKVMCTDYELLESPGYEPRKGIDAFKGYINSTRTTFPDFYLTIDEIIYEKDKIGVRWSITATHSGPGKFHPTGKSLKGSGLSVIHIKDGKIKDEWLANNNLMWLSQMGFTLVPPVPEEPEQ